ncbi:MULTISPECIES: Rz1-like lysis system protein LysC [Pseudomonadaceae]|uniref:Rz1-like lysis system protein LysC n=1 Tax=Pseudomonadaceae TaxID=135621 RepID=UPI001F0C6064|nr:MULTISPECIES: Rz1-like lysis system protein LysC [Pseudomonas]MDU9395397.1 Rz1-like lysis system protein LysC [Pseudomonas sp. zfem003]WMR32942.1 Rz1-like lysis system protein LysC [Pseudomonas otitidis]
MPTPTCGPGPLCLCLLLLAGCASAPPSAERTLTVTGCPAVVPCQLPATAPSANGDLLSDSERLEAAWADCAAQVDMLYRHQQGQP